MSRPTLEACTLTIERPVTWGSMDAFNHVNNTVYFRYFEDVRIAFFEDAGITTYMEEHGIGPILASTQCKFKFPLTYPDTLTIGTYISDLGDDRFTMSYVVYSQTHQRIAAVGDGLVVSYNYNENQKAPIPQEWLPFLQTP